ncbi:stemmadenine O-acetyltransferase [Tanacetum coccineum]
MCRFSTALGSRRLENNVKDKNDTETVDLHIISRERIKPSFATPHHLRNFKLSAIDQYMESLSGLLTGYYPFAGEINDNLHIECNDKGVYFIEARVNLTLHEFLRHPCDKKVRQLNPKHPSITESSSGNYVISVQMSIFNCGGIALSTSVAHKIIDGGSYFTFMKACTSAARGIPNLSPSFVASEVLPNNPSLKYWFPSNLIPTKEVVTKRFVFDSTTLAFLKHKPVSCNSKQTLLPLCGPTRVEAITALVWKAVAKAASTESIGNLWVKAIGTCYTNKQLDLSTLLGEIRESIAKINLDYIESLKGAKGHKAFDEMNDLLNGMEEGRCLFASSMLNSGIYETDFGWGKPIWFYPMNPGSRGTGIPGAVVFTDVLTGGGVEAIMSLSREEMEIFERDPEILCYTTPNPSPIQFFH